MLVLTRRKGEGIVIDGNIHVTVLGVKGDRIRLGITAPPSVSVNREEVHEREVHERRTDLAAGNGLDLPETCARSQSAAQ